MVSKGSFKLNTRLQKLKDKLSSLSDLRLLILFGSIAEGILRKGSDVDLIVEASEDAFKEVYEAFKREFECREVHIIRASWLEPKALLRMAKKGLVFVDRGLLSRLIFEVPDDYFELKELLKESMGSWLKEESIDLELIISIIAQVEEDVEILEELFKRLSEVFKDPLLKRAFERSLHTAIEGALDILRHIVSRVAPGSFETYKELVDSSKKIGVIGDDVAKVLKDLVDARHLLIHRYRGITDVFLKDCLEKVLSIWRPLRESIKTYLKSKGYDIG